MRGSKNGAIVGITLIRSSPDSAAAVRLNQRGELLALTQQAVRLGHDLLAQRR